MGSSAIWDKYRTRIKFRGINFRVLIQAEFRGYLISWGFYFVVTRLLRFLSSTHSTVMLYCQFAIQALRTSPLSMALRTVRAILAM